MDASTLKEVQDHVNKIKDSWEITGGSILLDDWVDQTGRDLVTFVADCPAGPVYLKSFDVSDIKSNSNALLLLVDGVLDDVGMHNVVQIIAPSSSGWVGWLGKSFASYNTNFFRSVKRISQLRAFMLVKIGKMDSLETYLTRSYNISEFLNNNPLLWKLFSDKVNGLTPSLVRLVKECDIQVKVATQLDVYRPCKDCFKRCQSS